MVIDCCLSNPVCSSLPSQALSPVGRCQSFEATADGYGRGEGIAALLLRRACDRISEGNGSRSQQSTDWDGVGGASGAAQPAPLAVLRGSAVNQDGRSSSLTAPNGPSQQVLPFQSNRENDTNTHREQL